MKIKTKLLDGGILPTRAHKEDAGFDIYAPGDITIPANSYAFIDSRVCMAIPEGYVGMLKSKSGLNVLKNLTGEGVIDAGYTGSIGVKLYNHGQYDQHILQGEKMIQIVIVPIAAVEELELVDNLEDTERGVGGFGSTGR